MATKIAQGKGPFYIKFREYPDNKDHMTFFQVDGEFLKARHPKQILLNRSKLFKNSQIRVLRKKVWMISIDSINHPLNDILQVSYSSSGFSYAKIFLPIWVCLFRKKMKGTSCFNPHSPEASSISTVFILLAIIEYLTLLLNIGFIYEGQLQIWIYTQKLSPSWSVAE